MTVRKGDSIRLLAETREVFGLRTVPAGTEGVVVLVHPDGGCEADVTSSVQTEEDGDIAQVVARPGQYEIIGGE